jgi:matrixin
VSLIPADFDLGAFDEMFRSSARLQRWMAAPSLVVLTTVMQYTQGDREDYAATSEQLTEAETELLIDQLTSALSLLTGGTFPNFGNIERESAASGSRVNVQRTGKIVVGRYRGVEGFRNTIGFGSWFTNGTGEVLAGSIFLDRDFDKASEMRNLLRTHELGHALGYNHVTTRRSIMNPAIGPEPTEFDRQGSVIAFQRKPGNQSPDIDPGAKPPSGGFGIAAPVSGWQTVVCGLTR